MTSSNGNGRVPPHDLEAERALLGAAMLDATGVNTLATVPLGDFHAPAHAHIATAIARLQEAGDPVEPVTVSQQLSRMGLLDTAGGSKALVDIMAGAPTPASVTTYARIVRDLAVLRRLVAAAGDIADRAYSGRDVTATVAHAQGLVTQIAETAPSGEISSGIVWGDVEAVVAGNKKVEDPAMLTRGDGKQLIYAGKLHVLHGEPSHGKGWVALVACREVLGEGGAVLYLDYEDTDVGIVGRLLALGCPPGVIAGRFVYARPDGPIGAAERVDLERKLLDLNPDLVIIDGVAEALTREGLDEDRAADYVTWVERLPRWIVRLGIAVVLIDHVTKSKDQRRYSRGSGAKLAVVDGAAYEVKLGQPFSRHREGSISVVIAKDRPGGVGSIGDHIAVFNVKPSGAGQHVTITVDPPTAKPGEDTWEPTRIMDAVVAELARSHVPLSARDVIQLLTHFKSDFVRQGIRRLVAKGDVIEDRRGADQYLRLVKAPAAGEPPPVEQTLDF